MSNATSLRVPKYGKHKATGQARVQINGRTVYLGKYGSAESHEAYRRLTAEWLQGKGTVRSQVGPVCVSQLMLEYLKFARTYYRKYGKPTREYEQLTECCKLIKKLYGRTPAAEFGPLRLKAVRECMIKADHSREFINKNIDRIRRMFKWAVAEELLPESVHRALKTVEVLKRGRTTVRETAPIQPVSDADVDATLEHLPQVLRDMVLVQRYSAMRAGELVQMRLRDFTRSGDVWIYHPQSHKTA
jgi:integrase